MPADDVAYGMRDSVLLGLEKLALDEVSTPTDSCPWLPSGTVSVVERVDRYGELAPGDHVERRQDATRLEQLISRLVLLTEQVGVPRRHLSDQLCVSCAPVRGVHHAAVQRGIGLEERVRREDVRPSAEGDEHQRVVEAG